MGSVDSQVEQLVRQWVPEPILASGWFHVAAAPDPPDSGGAIVGLIGFIVWAARSVARKRQWRMPSHTFWVVTPSLLYVFEFRFGSSTRLRQQVGVWGRRAVQAQHGEAPNRVVIRLPGEGAPFELEGDRFTAQEAEVIRLLTGA